MADKPTQEERVEKGDTKISYYEAVGRRKTASARARLYVSENKEFTVNGKPVETFFPGEVFKKMYTEPFRTTNTVGRFAVSIKTTGGGLPGQLGATIHAISRALLKVDNEKFRPILKKRGFLMRDPRAKQRRKAGFAGKSRARKQSPKR